MRSVTSIAGRPPRTSASASGTASSRSSITTTGMTGASATTFFDGERSCVSNHHLGGRRSEHRRAVVRAADALAERREQLAARAVRRVLGQPRLALAEVDVDLEPAGLGVDADDVAVAHA